MSMCRNSCIRMFRSLLQDLAALDAIEASHYAAKQTQSGTVPPAASGVPAASGPICDLAHEQQQLHANLQHEHLKGPTDEHPYRQHVHSISTVAQTDRFSSANPPLTHCVEPAIQTSSWLQQQPQFQHVSSRHAPRQSSMQSFMAVHTTHRASAQPNLPAAATAAPSSSSAQQHVKAAHATGMLTDDVDDCIDLTNQPEPQIPQDAPQARHMRGAAQPTYHLQLAEAEAVAHDQAVKGTDKEAVEDIVDDHPEDKLMECSSNLLNPGIRVHKYSFGFPLPAVTCTTIFSMMSPSHHCGLSDHATLRLTAVQQHEHKVNTVPAYACVLCCVHVLMLGSCTDSCLQSTMAAAGAMPSIGCTQLQSMRGHTRWTSSRLRCCRTHWSVCPLALARRSLQLS